MRDPNDLGVRLPTARQILARAMSRGGRRQPGRVELRGSDPIPRHVELGLCACNRPVRSVLVASHRTEDQHAVTLVHIPPPGFDDLDNPWEATAFNVAYEIAMKRSCSALVGKDGLVTAHAVHRLMDAINERVRAYRVQRSVEGGA